MSNIESAPPSLDFDGFRRSGRDIHLPQQVGLLPAHVREQLGPLANQDGREDRVIRLYAGGLFIEHEASGDYGLCIGNGQWTRPENGLTELEAILFEWAVDEGYFVDTDRSQAGDPAPEIRT